MAASSLLSGAVTLVFWGLGDSLIRLLSFAVLYGLFSGGFSVLFARFATSLADDAATQTWIYTIFDLQRGVMIVIGGLTSGYLPRGPVVLRAYGSGKYEMLILFTGTCLVVSSLGGLSWFFRRRSFHLPRWWRKVAPNHQQTRTQPGMDQLVSTFEYSIRLDIERGLLHLDEIAHQRYLRSFRQAIEGSWEPSVSSSSSQVSKDRDDLPSVVLP